MEKKKRVTMYDVAQAANVTPQTVSRAFRNTDDISPETRKRILQIADNLHYVMNNTASSLRVGNSRLIVVVYDNLINVYFSIMIDYLQSSLRKMGYSILMLSVPSANFDRGTYEFAVSHNAAGVVSFLEPASEIDEMVRNFKIPILIVGRRTRLPSIDYLCTDDEEGGRLAAEWLIARGIERFVYLTVDIQVSCAFDRYQGFSREIVRRGFALPPCINAYTTPLRDTLQTLFRDRASAPQGFFCFNDMLAFELLYDIEEMGLPPVYVVGYDCVQREIPIPARLTSLGPDKSAFADRAAEMIVNAIENKRIGGRGESMRVMLNEVTELV